MLLFVLLAVFIAGLMVGDPRVPRQEDRGAGDQARHDGHPRRAAARPRPHRVAIRPATAASDLQQGPAGLPEILTPTARRPTTTARRSPATPGSSSQRTRTTPARSTVTFSQLLGGVSMLLGRFLPMLVALAVAGALVGKRVTPAGLGTMRTDTRCSSSCSSGPSSSSPS